MKKQPLASVVGQELVKRCYQTLMANNKTFLEYQRTNITWGGISKQHSGNKHVNPPAAFKESKTVSGHDFSHIKKFKTRNEVNDLAKQIYTPKKVADPVKPIESFDARPQKPSTQRQEIIKYSTKSFATHKPPEAPPLKVNQVCSTQRVAQPIPEPFVFKETLKVGVDPVPQGAQPFDNEDMRKITF